MATSTTEQLEKARFYLEEAHRYFDIVNDARRKIDDKINNFIALSGVLVNVTLGLALLFPGQKNSITTLWLLFVSVVLYLVVIVIGLISYRPAKIITRDIKGIIEKFENAGSETQLFEPIQHLAWNLSRDAEENRKGVSKKAKSFRIMLVVFGIGIFFLAIALGSLALTSTLTVNPNVGNFTS